MTSYFQDGGHDVSSHRKVLPTGECTHSICPEHMQQRLQFLIHSISSTYTVCVCPESDTC